MKILSVAICVGLIAMAPLAAAARGGGHRYGGYRSSYSYREPRYSYGYREPRFSYGRLNFSARRDCQDPARRAAVHALVEAANASRTAQGLSVLADPCRVWDDLRPADLVNRPRRSALAKADFKRGHPCPSTGLPHGPCPGYVIDHIQALKRGGPDVPSNMQWQTVEAAKAKDRIE
jgi:hypothetical protein